MSARGDLKKALKEGGYRLVGSGRHFHYEDAAGHRVSIHLGDKMRGSAFTTRLKDIKRGNVVSGKKRPEAPAAWEKVSPRIYVLKKGAAEVGRCEQREAGPWEAVDMRRAPETLGSFQTLASAKDCVERRVR